MRRVISILSLAVLLQAGIAWGQLAPANELGLSLGHLHLFAPDWEKESKAWWALGGQLGSNLSSNIPITFPGIVILMHERKGGGGSAGTMIDHVAFRVPNLQASLTKWKGVDTWWLRGRARGWEGSWGLKFEPGTRPDQAFVTTPGGVKIEILEDKALRIPIVFDHIHIYVVASQIKEMEDYYTKTFGAKPVKGEADTLSMPGGKLVFSKTDTPPLLPRGRTLDHFGFNMANAEALDKFTKRLQDSGTKIDYHPASMGMTHMSDGFGLTIEITKAQGGYADLSQLDPAFWVIGEDGKKEGEAPAKPAQ